MTDPIADMLARIRNAVSAKHSRVDIPASKLKLEIARILKEEGYINNFVLKGEGAKRMIRIFLRYDARGASSITYLQRVSRPGRRVYVGSHQIPRVLGGYGLVEASAMERLFRDARLGPFSPISNEMVRNFVGERLGLPRTY